MANVRLIKGRIKAAKNISQITQAMQMVAASKMRKAQSLALSGRPYAEKIAEVVELFVSRIDPTKHPLLSKATGGKRLIILISTNKGLCGSLNTSLFRLLLKTFTQDELNSSSFATLGKKGEMFLARLKLPLAADFSNTTNISQTISAITSFVVSGFLKGEYNEVYVIYNNFINALKQEPVSKKILPITSFDLDLKKEDKSALPVLDFLVEPGIDEILEPLLFHYLENQVRDSLLEADACEHSARMIAMKNATDNANEFVDLLTLEYNKARQEKITYEIADIVTARLAVEISV